MIALRESFRAGCGRNSPPYATNPLIQVGRPDVGAAASVGLESAQERTRCKNSTGPVLSRVAQPLGFCPHRSERTDFPYSALLEVYPDFSRRPPRERQPDGVEGARSARAAGRTGPSSNAADCGAPAHGTRCAPPGSPTCARPRYRVKTKRLFACSRAQPARSHARSSRPCSIGEGSKSAERCACAEVPWVTRCVVDSP